jgi:hypothetical protein
MRKVTVNEAIADNNPEHVSHHEYESEVPQLTKYTLVNVIFPARIKDRRKSENDENLKKNDNLEVDLMKDIILMAMGFK